MTGPHPAIGQASHGTGDLNLAAALMAVGFPLEPRNECDVINSDRLEKSHGRWFVMPMSMDGKLDAYRLMQAWSGVGDKLPANHCFSWVCEFIRYGREHGCTSARDWLSAAHDHCRDLGLKSDAIAKAAFHDDGEVRIIGDSREAYIFAFVSCREFALRLFHQKKQIKIHQHKGMASSLIDTRLPKPVRNELLARLDG